MQDPYLPEDKVPNSFFVPQYSGVRYRTFDFSFSSQQRADLDKRLSSFDRYHWDALLSMPGTKIGPTYFEVQAGWDPRDWIEEEKGTGWQLVATFYSVGADWLSPVAKTMPLSEKFKDKFYMGDPGHLLLFSRKPNQATSYFIF